MSEIKRRPSRWYDEALLRRAAEGPMTARDVAAIVDISEAVVMSYLRKNRKGLKVTLVGRKQGMGRAGLYKIEKENPAQ